MGKQSGSPGDYDTFLVISFAGHELRNVSVSRWRFDGVHGSFDPSEYRAIFVSVYSLAIRRPTTENDIHGNT